MKKNKLSHILSILFHFHNDAIIRKRMHSANESFLIRLWKNALRRGFSALGTNPRQKNIINYITSRNMRKIISPLNGLNESDALNQHDKMNALNIKEILSLMSVNWQQSKKLFPLFTSTSILQFCTSTAYLGKLISKQTKGKRDASSEGQESQWGGPEAFELIIFLKEDFDEVIRKYPSVIVLFHAYWCPHCLRLKKPFGNAALMAKEAKLPIAFAAFDVTTNPEIADEKGVIGIPMIKYYKNGNYVTTYKGKRIAEDLFEFAKNPPPPPDKVKTADV